MRKLRIWQIQWLKVLQAASLRNSSIQCKHLTIYIVGFDDVLLLVLYWKSIFYIKKMKIESLIASLNICLSLVLGACSDTEEAQRVQSGVQSDAVSADSEQAEKGKSDSSTITINGQEVDLASIPVREVDWKFCQTLDSGEEQCMEDTSVVWVHDKKEGNGADFVEPEAFLMPAFYNHVVTIESYGCFPRYEEPQEFALYEVGGNISLEGVGVMSGQQSLYDTTRVPVEISDIRPLDAQTVKAWIGESQSPVSLSVPNQGLCQQKIELEN